MTIRVGIVGYGNLGRGVEASICQNPDMKLIAVFTRRNPDSLKTNDKSVKVLHVDKAREYVNDIDVLILCGGSATDLPVQGPYFSMFFNTVDSYDTHAKILEYSAAVNKSALANGKTAAISIGWDPGLFSMNRVLAEAVLPQGKEYTFWGRGVSQGHSDAVRRVNGVKNAVQYTVPVEKSLQKVRNGETPQLTTGEKHIRECFVVPEAEADKEKISHEIKSMPHYFNEYETSVTFITEEEFAKNHTGMPHGGFVIRSGQTGQDPVNNHIVEFSINLDSNPEFTASILVAYARAVYRLNCEGQIGAKTVFDIPLAYLSARTSEELLRELL
ncbi:MAG: diaminopimelate dehydrogenase [Bacillota bacterium]|nr:diaminopimelate dehydrogenase [Bacillota bacterium]